MLGPAEKELNPAEPEGPGCSIAEVGVGQSIADRRLLTPSARHAASPPRSVGVFYMPDLIRSGFRTVRIELVDEQPQYVAPLLEGYR